MIFNIFEKGGESRNRASRNTCLGAIGQVIDNLITDARHEIIAHRRRRGVIAIGADVLTLQKVTSFC